MPEASLWAAFAMVVCLLMAACTDRKTAQDVLEPQVPKEIPRWRKEARLPHSALAGGRDLTAFAALRKKRLHDLALFLAASKGRR